MLKAGIFFPGLWPATRKFSPNFFLACCEPDCLNSRLMAKLFRAKDGQGDVIWLTDDYVLADRRISVWELDGGSVWPLAPVQLLLAVNVLSEWPAGHRPDSARGGFVELAGPLDPTP